MWEDGNSVTRRDPLEIGSDGFSISHPFEGFCRLQLFPTVPRLSCRATPEGDLLWDSLPEVRGGTGPGVVRLVRVAVPTHSCFHAEEGR
jgi:hypothetical protein